MENSKQNIWLPLIATACIALGLVMGYTVSNSRRYYGRSANPAAGLNKIDYTLGLIQSAYIDSIPSDTLIEALMPELMAQLDPHSVYIPASDMQAVNEPLDGEFDGIGVIFNMTTDTVVVLNIIAGGPSYKAGIMPGDRIITIGSDTVSGRHIEQDDIVGRLRGKRGTVVNVGIERQNVKGLVKVDITRDKIPVKSIDAAFIIQPTIGYVKLTSFSRNTHKEFVEAVTKLKKQGMERLVLDLRGNSGGFLDQAIMIADELLPAQKPIVYTKDRAGHEEREYSTGKGSLQQLPLVVLIDEYSASSSEILTGAIQDNDRGTVVGRRSFGKGLVQSQIPFPDGSAIRLTVARYYTPTGRSIQKPYRRGQAGYEDDIYNRYMGGQFFSADSIHFADSLRYTTPGGKTVYGGGGIMPDVFVPLDTLEMTPYYYTVTGKNILYKYTLDYTDAHRARINRIKTLEELQKFLDADSGLLEDFVAYASRQGVRPDRKQIAKSGRLMTALLRAYIGRNTELQDEGYFANIRPVDAALLKALEVVSEER